MFIRVATPAAPLTDCTNSPDEQTIRGETIDNEQTKKHASQML